jgi:cytochrome oxidase Cu insertion factor (SCO1/SenC/PrrC family)
VVTRLLSILGVLAVLVATAAGSAPAAPRFIPMLQAGDAIPQLPLVAQDNRGFSLADLRGNAIGVSFIYTRCRDARMCPLVAAKFARAQHAIGSAPIRLVILTLDPNFDTPRVLARYGAGFGLDPRYWTLATGSQASIEELAGRFGIATSVTTPGSIIHTEAAVIIAPDGRIARIVEGNNWSADELVEYARATLPGSGDPFAGARAWLSAAVERCGGSGVALGGTAMLAILGLAIAVVGGAFWFAFRGSAASDGSR